MATTKPTSVSEYLASLPAERREALEAVREAINRNLPRGYEEGMQYGMIGWYVPHTVYPPGYHCNPTEPLPFAGLASQKNHMGLYLFGLYGNEEGVERFRREWEATGRKLDMGKACVRFRKLQDVPLEVLGAAVKRMPVKKFVEHYEGNIRSASAKRSAARAASKKPAKRTTKAAANKVARKAAAPPANRAPSSGRPTKSAKRAASPGPAPRRPTRGR